MASIDDLPSSSLRPSKISGFLKDYGPTFTLFSVIVTSYWSYRALSLNASTSRAELYIRDVVFVVQAGKDSTSEVGVLMINAGHMAAHVLKHRLMFTLGKIDGPSPVINENNMEEVEETIDHDHPLTFTIGIPPELIPPALSNTEPRASAVYQAWKDEGQRLFFLGKIQYRDGVDIQWKDWCKYLGADGKWKTCPPNRDR